MNLPNRITIARMVLAAPFLALQIAALVVHGPVQYAPLSPRAGLLIGGAALFMIAMVSDWADGYIARRRRQITVFGQLFDPLADKIITSSLLIFLSVLGAVPFYITIIFIGRDLVVDGARNLAAAQQQKVAANGLGKAKTLVLSFALPLILLVTPALSAFRLDAVNPGWALWLLNIPVFVALGLALVSGYTYLRPLAPLFWPK